RGAGGRARPRAGAGGGAAAAGAHRPAAEDRAGAPAAGRARSGRPAGARGPGRRQRGDHPAQQPARGAAVSAPGPARPTMIPVLPRRFGLRVLAAVLLAGAVATAGAAGPATWKRGIENQRQADLGDGTFLIPVLLGGPP